jgi:hypothetical protein
VLRSRTYRELRITHPRLHNCQCRVSQRANPSSCYTTADGHPRTCDAIANGNGTNRIFRGGKETYSFKVWHMLTYQNPHSPSLLAKSAALAGEVYVGSVAIPHTVVDFVLPRNHAVARVVAGKMQTNPLPSCPFLDASKQEACCHRLEIGNAQCC